MPPAADGVTDRLPKTTCAPKLPARRRGHSQYAAVVDLGPSITSTLVVVALGVAVLALATPWVEQQVLATVRTGKGAE